MDKVHDQLWITDVDRIEKDMVSVSQKVDFIINLSPWCDHDYANENDYVHIPINDGVPDVNQYLFNKAVDIALERLEAGDKLLVHCGAGISRSVAVAATALTYYRNSKFPDQLGRVVDKRESPGIAIELKRLGEKYLKSKEDYNIKVDR